MKFFDYIVVSQISSSYAPTGPLLKYLRKRYSVLSILHPFFDIKEKPTIIELFELGNKINEFYYLKKCKTILPESLNFFLGGVFSLLYLLSHDHHSKSYVGMDCFSALMGVIGKKLGFFETIIYYNVDFSRKRFENRIFNAIYVLLDKSAVNLSDITFCVSQRIITTRILEGVSPSKLVHVPNGFHSDSIPKFDIADKNQSTLIYVGAIEKEKGLQNIINTFPEILKINPSVRLKIIGSGTYLGELKQQIMNLGIDSYIDFFGQLTNNEVMHILINEGIGLALYNDSRDYVYYSDPVKVKEYLACGCPVICTNLPEISEKIIENNMGYTINSIDEISKGYFNIISEFNSKSNNCLNFVKEYDWDIIFHSAQL